MKCCSVQHIEAHQGSRAQMKQQCLVHFMYQGLPVLEAVGLPEGYTGSGNFVAVKVSLGEQQFVTRHKRQHRGKTAPWNSKFAFQVLSLGKTLLVEICDAEGDVVVAGSAIEIRTIFQPWFRDDYVSLDQGGRVHLTLNFVLTKEERKRLEYMRAAAERKEFQKRRDDMLRLYDFKRKEELCVNSGLRTIAENSRVHAGQPLDNWEVFSRKKGKETRNSTVATLDPTKQMDSSYVRNENEDTIYSKLAICTPNAFDRVDLKETSSGLVTVSGKLEELGPNLMQLPKVREEPRASGQVQVPTLNEGKQRSLPSLPNDSIVEPGLLQQVDNNNSRSSTYQAEHTSRLSNAWVRVEKDSSMKSEDLSKKERTGSKVSAPIDGWICVERPIPPAVPPSMTWEVALKVAQKAREAAIDAKSKTPSPSTCPSELNAAYTPLISQPSRERHFLSQILSGQIAGVSPFPLPPKQSPSIISHGCVKARINAFESSVLQAPDPSVSKLENEAVQEESTTAGILVVAKDGETQSLESLKNWEDRGRNKGQSPRDVGNQSDCRGENQDSLKTSSSQDLRRDSIAKDQEPRLPDVCQRSRYNKQVEPRRLDAKVTRNLTMQEESRDTLTAYRLPKPQDVSVEAMENQLQQKSLMEETLMSSMVERLSQTSKGEVGNIQDEIICESVSQMQRKASMEKLGSKEQGKFVAAKNGSLVENDPVKTKDVDSQESRVTPERHTEPHYSNKVRRLRNPLGSPKPARPGGSLQAWKDLQDSLEQKARKSLMNRALLKENFKTAHVDKDQISSKSMDDAFVAAVQQIDIFIKEKHDIVLEHKESPPIGPASCDGTFHTIPQQCPRVFSLTSSEDTSYKTREVSIANDNKILSHLGGGVKQVLSGVAILAGLFVLWPKDSKRYHVVKAGETLSRIAPEQCIDPSSHFCKINPQVCEHKTIYPGQRIRLF